VKGSALRQTILTAMFLAIVVVQEFVLSSIPNVQLTFVLMLVYASILSPAHLVMLTIGYVLLDNMLMGSFSYFIVVPMFIAWGVYLFFARLIRYRSIHMKIFFASAFGLIYGWFYIPFTYLAFYQGNPEALIGLLLADLPFGMVLVINNLFTVVALYQPLTALFKSFIHQPL
jgi:hypothetical protein